MLQPQHLCDVWFEKTNKDMPGWRGPATVLSVNHEDGNVTVRFQGRTIDRKTTEVRTHVPFLVFESALFADRFEHFRAVQRAAEDLTPGQTHILGLLRKQDGQWQLTKSAAESPGRELLQSAMIAASSALYLQGCLAIRLCRGVPNTQPLAGFNGVEVWYWLSEQHGGNPGEAPFAFTSETSEITATFTLFANQ